MVSPSTQRPRSYAHAPRLPEHPALDLRTLFPRPAGPQAVVELEIGCARGGFLLERLAVEPAVCLVGFEIQRKAATQAAEKIDKFGFAQRCAVFSEDAREVLPRLAAECVSRVFLHFPDPWWKKRHTKRRLASPELVAQIARLLYPGGELFIQTDVDDLARAFARAVEGEPSLQPSGASAFIDENPFGACSPRERQAHSDGLPILRQCYRKGSR